MKWNQQNQVDHRKPEVQQDGERYQIQAIVKLFAVAGIVLFLIGMGVGNEHVMMVGGGFILIAIVALVSFVFR